MRICRDVSTLLIGFHFTIVAAQASKIGAHEQVPGHANEAQVVNTVDRGENQGWVRIDHSKCTAAGLLAQSFQKDEYDLGSWRVEHLSIHGGSPDGENKKSSCKSASVNVRGSYTSHLVPCRFQFFQIRHERPENLNPFAMSTACSDASPMKNHPEVEQYVVKWPDECVADFDRCYNLIRDETILLRHMCKFDWKIPDGATHVSVSCIGDRKEKQERSKKRNDDNQDPFLKHQQDALKQLKDL